jgi:transposase-like protein
MAKRKYSPERIVSLLREVEIDLGKGLSTAQACKKIGVTPNTYYRWRKTFGGLRIDQARRLKELERENARLKKVVADLTLDKEILKEAAEGNF